MQLLYITEVIPSKLHTKPNQPTSATSVQSGNVTGKQARAVLRDIWRRAYSLLGSIPDRLLQVILGSHFVVLLFLL